MKKYVIRLILGLLLAGLALAGCDNGSPSGGDEALSGSISISPANATTVGNELTATYSGSETVSYQWYRNGSAVSGATSHKYTPANAGSYTVSVSATGYTSKTSDSVSVADTTTATPGLAYKLLNDNTSYEVTRGSVTSGIVVIPATYKGKPVTTLGFDSIGEQGAFEGTDIISIIIPDSVTSIEQYAFSACTSLTSITIPGSVDHIKYNTFSNCTSLASITILDGVTDIGYHAFYNCTNLATITIPDSVSSICYRAFSNCARLTSITIPKSVTFIGDYAFSGCTSLTTVDFQKGRTRLDFESRGEPFPGNLLTTYKSGGDGIYTRTSGGSDYWTKRL